MLVSAHYSSLSIFPKLSQLTQISKLWHRELPWALPGEAAARTWDNETKDPPLHFVWGLSIVRFEQHKIQATLTKSWRYKLAVSWPILSCFIEKRKEFMLAFEIDNNNNKNWPFKCFSKSQDFFWMDHPAFCISWLAEKQTILCLLSAGFVPPGLNVFNLWNKAIWYSNIS